MTAIADNLQAIRQRIAAAKRGGEVTLLAVSKGHGIEQVREAAAAGQRAFGENYVQEALAKIEAAPELEWHLVGPLQSNKTRAVAERFAWVQTVDREKIAARLSAQRPAHLAPLNVLIQVNASGEPSKSGVAPGDVEALAAACARLPRIRVRGLMAIPEPGAPASRYREMRELFERLAPRFGWDTLSMGMSADMELAIAEGATMVRIGTALFGERRKERSAA